MRPPSIAALVLAAALLVPAAALAAEPPRVAVITPAQPDAAVREAETRLTAELTAAGFTVVLVPAAPGADPRDAVEHATSAAHPAATVTLAPTGSGPSAHVWIADPAAHTTVVRRVDPGATPEATRPAALSIRTVELLRAALLEGSAGAAPASPVEAQPPGGAPGFVVAPAVEAAPWGVPPARAPRALLEGFSVALGMATLHGLGDTGGRLAPVVHVAYGAASGLAARLTLVGPTASDQVGLLEAAYGFGRAFHTIAPVLALGAGGAHTSIEGSGGPGRTRVRTRAWSAVLGGSAGIAARASDRAAFVLDTHLLCAVPAAGAVVDTRPAPGRPSLLVVASLGVVAGF